LAPGAFTRQRKLTLPRIVAMMLAGMRGSVQAELDHLFGQIHALPVRSRQVSAQAFSKARRGFSARVFELANAHLLQLARPLIDRHRWHGLRVVAADASRLYASTRAGAHLDTEHCAFALFLPGAELTLHADLHPVGCERQMLFESLEHVQPHTDVLVLDRGFPGRALLAALSQSHRHFCVRIDKMGWKGVDAFLLSGKPDAIITLSAPRKRDALTYEIARTPTTVRLVRDVTPTGSVRVLMTSLLDAQHYPAHAFSALYHRRWRVEEAFKRLKHRLRLEAATGRTHLAFQQDFAAKVLADNLHTVLTAPDQDDIASDDPKGHEPATRPNRTYALGALRPILAGCLLRLRHCLRALPAALLACATALCRIQPDRSYPRPPRIKPRVHAAYRLGC